MLSIFGLSFNCRSQLCFRTRLRRRAASALFIDHRPLHRVEIGPPHLFAFCAFLSKVGFEPVTLCSRCNGVSESGLDLLGMPPPSTSVALYSFPCHLLQLAGNEEYPQELHKPAQFRPYPPAGPHEIPDIEEALRHLIQGFLAIARIGLLQNPLTCKAGQLSRSDVSIESRLLRHFHRGHRVPS